MRWWNRGRKRDTDGPRLGDLLQGYRATCVIVTAVRLGLVERLANGAVDEDGLADELCVHLPSLRRLIRALAALGVVSIEGQDVALTRRGRALLKGERGLWHSAVLAAEEYLPAWTELAHSVRTGAPAFERVFGMDVWAHRERHPELGEAFARMGNAAPRTLDLIAAAVDLAACKLVVDVGGGRGQLLAALLGRVPRARGIVFDAPHVVAGAADVLRDAGVLERGETVGGSFFESVPPGGDLYVLQHVLHDWDDDACVAILGRCRAAMPAASTLVVVEHLLPADGAPTPLATAMLDLHMLAVVGGRERTCDEYGALLAAAGFDLLRPPAGRGELAALVATPSAAATPPPPRPR
jgi:hypothetical protein